MLFLLASHWDFKESKYKLNHTILYYTIPVYAKWVVLFIYFIFIGTLLTCIINLQVYPRSIELAVHEGNSGLVSTGFTSKNVIIFIGWCRGTSAGHRSLRRVCVRWIMPGGFW